MSSEYEKIADIDHVRKSCMLDFIMSDKGRQKEFFKHYKSILNQIENEQIDEDDYCYHVESMFFKNCNNGKKEKGNAKG